MEFKQKKSIYLQIADWVCDKVLAGELAEGDKAPSVRDVAAELEVNVNTVARTFEYLQQHGIVVVRRGLGNFVADGAREAIGNMRRETFFNEQLPELFNAAKALGIGIKEIEEAYRLAQDDARYMPK